MAYIKRTETRRPIVPVPLHTSKLNTSKHVLKSDTFGLINQYIKS